MNLNRTGAISITQLKAVQESKDTTQKKFKVRVFSFCSVLDIKDYHRLINMPTESVHILETKDTFDHGCYTVAVSWQESVDTGIDVLAGVDRLED
mgnify:CR=1 FL=1